MIDQIVDLILYEADNRKCVDLPANIVEVQVDVMLKLMEFMGRFQEEERNEWERKKAFRPPSSAASPDQSQ